MKKLKLLDLFSGIGGFSLGLESTNGFETIAFVEKDDFCQKVLKKHWPNINIEGDIRNVKGDKYEADIITGGFPCQPFSVAGKRKGTDDDRYLWDETIRVVRECKPRWFIGENVEGLININNGLVLRQVQTDLEKESFEVQCLVIPAAGIGAWHQRKRIWIMGYSHNNGYSSTKIKRSNNKTYDNSKERENQTRRFERTDGPINNGNVWLETNVSNSNTGFSIGENKKIQTRRSSANNGSEDVSNSESIGYRGWSSKECKIEEWSFLQREQEGRKVGSEVEGCDGDVSDSNNKRLQGFNSKSILREQEFGFTTNKNDENRETWWQTQSRICGVPDGVSFKLDKNRNNRIKSLGNSIVPQIVRQLGLAILEAEKITQQQ